MDHFLFKDNMHESDYGVDLTDDHNDSVFIMELDKSERGLGLGLIDGLVSYYCVK